MAGVLYVHHGLMYTSEFKIVRISDVHLNILIFDRTIMIIIMTVIVIVDIIFIRIT